MPCYSELCDCFRKCLALRERQRERDNRQKQTVIDTLRPAKVGAKAETQPCPQKSASSNLANVIEHSKRHPPA